MRIILFTLIVFLIAISVLFAAGDQAYLGIFAETKVSKMVGMPAFELPPGVDINMLKNMPGMDKMLSMGAPQRVLNVRLWSPSLAPKDAFAYINPPEGLKQGKKLDLELYRPEPVKGTTDGSSDSTGKPEGMDKFTIKIYWGSSDKVKAGQPKIISFASLTPEQQETMRKEAEKAQKADSYFYKPDWTTGYWPTKKQPGKIADDASLVGTYALTTNYTGNVSLDAPSNVNFLAPIEMTSRIPPCS